MFPVVRAHPRYQLGIADEGIEQLALYLRLLQRLVFVLAVDIDQAVAKLAQLRQGRIAAVDEGLAAAVAV